MSIRDRVAAFVRERALFQTEDRLLLAVSGGPDSMCMLHVLAEVHPDLVVAHFDHRLRPDSDRDAAVVRTAASSLRLRFIAGGADVGTAAVSSGESIEATARRLRYQFLADSAKQLGAGVIATGHTRSDQAETVLMHLVRGAGPDGLAGMRPKQALSEWPRLKAASGLSLIRPLLVLSRTETLEFCEANQLEYVSDPSNSDVSFTRNRVRLEVMPELRRVNPDVEAAMARTAEILRAVTEHMRHHGEAGVDAWARHLRDGGVAMPKERLSALDVAEQRALLRAAILKLTDGACQVSFDRVEAARAFIAEDGSGFLQLGCGLELSVAGDELRITPTAKLDLEAWPQLPVEMALDPEGAYELSAGWGLRLTRRPPPDLGHSQSPGHISQSGGPWREWFDASELRSGLQLRWPRAGDRFRPFGMAGSVKVGDIFTNAHIDRRYRQEWPLLLDGDEVLWVVGLRRGAAAPLGPHTESVVEVELTPPD